MNKPKPKYEIHTQIDSHGIVYITPESLDMEQRVMDEAPDFGQVSNLPGQDYIMVFIRPTFDLDEVAVYIGRGGPVTKPIDDIIVNINKEIEQ
jgi:hypothetical protein